tara:strand:+ start:947 stop:1144 length:198 start_codon:yes stop_codon:yes gene_type:complete
MNKTDLSIMLFLFNALNDGWVVKKIDDKSYEFIKKKEEFNYSKKIYLDNDFLNNFINKNLKLENI